LPSLPRRTTRLLQSSRDRSFIDGRMQSLAQWFNGLLDIIFQPMGGGPMGASMGASPDNYRPQSSSRTTAAMAANQYGSSPPTPTFVQRENSGQMSHVEPPHMGTLGPGGVLLPPDQSPHHALGKCLLAFLAPLGAKELLRLCPGAPAPNMSMNPAEGNSGFPGGMGGGLRGGGVGGGGVDGGMNGIGGMGSNGAMRGLGRRGRRQSEMSTADMARLAVEVRNTR
jgi:hypothetical protein